MRMPSADDVAPAEAGEARGDERPPNLPTDATTMMTPQTSHSARRRDEADLRAHAGEGEERGQEQHDDDVLEAVGELARQAGVVRDDRAEREGAEDGVDADDLGGAGGESRSATKTRAITPWVRRPRLP